MTNPLLAVIAPLLSAPLGDIKSSLGSLVANPTTENLTAQGEKLALDALNPATLGSLSIGAVAQEALNVIAAIEAHLFTAASAPSSVTATPAV